MGLAKVFPKRDDVFAVKIRRKDPIDCVKSVSSSRVMGAMRFLTVDFFYAYMLMQRNPYMLAFGEDGVSGVVYW